VRLTAVRVRRPDGSISDVIDIRQPVTLEVEYHVLRIGTQLVPNLHLYNDAGVCVFITSTPPAQEPRTTGKHTSTTTIPGNFLSEGTMIISAAISTLSPVIIHVNERDAVAFEVIDSLDGDSARGGDFGGSIPGVVRPLLEWKTVRHVAP
jgi:lipopolysaccharide transport system ATP-binding protein